MFSKSVVKYIQSLQHKKFRDEHNVFIAEGPKVVDEFLAGQYFTCKHIYATNEWIQANIENYGKHEEIITVVKDFELEKLSGLRTPNKVVAEFAQKKFSGPASLKSKITLVLDDIRDPGNLGTIIRTADWFNVENIICSESTVDMYNSKVVQSTMASLGRVNIVYTNLSGFLENHKYLTLYCAVLDEAALEKKTINEGLVLIGNESKGIDADLLVYDHQKISIKKYGAAESLNASVATGIILYALK